MSLALPTTQEIADQIVAQVEAQISQTIPLLPKAFTRVLAKVLAGVVAILYRHIGFWALQKFVQHASYRPCTIGGRTFVPLIEWGRLFGVGDPTAATRPEHTITVQVLTQTGEIEQGRVLLHEATGTIHEVLAPVQLDAASVTVRIRCVGDQNNGDGSGSLGNLSNGEELTFANPLAQIKSVATVASQEVTGADQQSESVYRSRVVRRVQRPPQGGAYADYQQWGEEVAGILNVYPYTGLPGDVDLFVEAVATAESPDGIPTQAQLDAVGASVQFDKEGLPSRRPANAAVNILPITRSAWDYIISGLDPDTPELRAQIEDGIDEHLRSREPFIVGLSVLPRKDRILESEVAGIVHGIASATGASVTTVSQLIGVTPTPTGTLGHAEKAKKGTVTWL